MTNTDFIWMRHAKHLTLESTTPLPSISELAHSLSQINRWTGWADYPISVAQHSVFVSLLVRPELALHGLLHDAHECLTGDINTPVKRWLKSRRLEQLETLFDTARIAAFGVRALDEGEQAELKLADLFAAYEEARIAVSVPVEELNEHFGDPAHPPVQAMLARLPAPASVLLTELSWREAREAFVRRHEALTGAA